MRYRRPVDFRAGVELRQHGFEAERTIDIAASPDSVYDVWSRYENFPHFMSHVIEVREALPLTSDVLVVREDTYQQNKAMLKAFVRAWRDSVQWSIANPEQAALQAQKKAIDGQNLELNREIIRLRNLSSVSAYTQRHGLGAVDIEALQKGAQAYQAVGLISRLPDMRSVVATDVLP